MSFDRQRGWRYDEPQESHREQQRHDYEQHHDHHGNQPGPGREQYGRFERGPERPYMDHPHMHMQQHHHHHDHHHHDHHHDYYQEHFGHHKSDDASRVMPAGRRNKYDVTINDVLSIPTSPANRQENDPIAKMLLPHKGYLVMVRFRNDNFGDVVTGFGLNVSSLKAHGGSIIGFAEQKNIYVKEDANFNWKPHYNAACALIFNDLQAAVSFFNSARTIKQNDWPSSDGYQAVAVPLNWSSTNNTSFDPSKLKGDKITLLWTEYPTKFYDHYNNPGEFKRHYTDVVSENIIRVGGSPFIAVTKYLAGVPDPKKGRVAQSIRSPWVNDNGVITISYFPSMNDVNDYYDQEAVKRAYSFQNRVTKATSVAITFEKIDSKGYLMLVRTREQDIADFINGVQDNTSALTAHGGYIIGFASTEDIRVYEENIRGDPRKAWYRQRPAACLMWFKELQSAMVWFSSAKHVKQPDFPNNNPFQLVAVPLNRTSPNGTMFDPRRFMEKQITILWTEYPKFPQNDDTIQHALQEYSDVASNMVKENGGSPFVATARYHAGLPPNPQPGVSLPRVSRTIKTCWLEPGAVIAASCFPHSDNVDAFYRTESVQRAISRQYSVIRGTSLCMTFHKLQRTR